MKAVITGKDGFVGGYLANLLEKSNIEVVGFDLKQNQDIRDFEQLRNFLDKHKPQYIYHLAAQAYVPESFVAPQRTIEVNTIGSLNILEAVKQLGINTKILLAGTSEEYGSAENNDELSLPEPKSPYAIAKLAMDYLGRWYGKTYNMNVVVTRAFNHTGAGRGEMYAESSFAKQIAEIEKEMRSNLKHGNLSSIRNYTDVRDVVRAYKLAIELPCDVYNVCSEQNLSMQEVLNILISHASCNIKTEIDSSRMRASDFSFAEPSAAKLKALTNWKSEHRIENTLLDILNYWRANI